MTSSYNSALVAVSLVIAALASYTALDLAGRVTVATGRARACWLTAGAIAMGLGIWSMHFVGMLAFVMPMPMAYDVWLVLISAAVAMLASGFAMFVVSRDRLTLSRIIRAGIAMGIAIAGMHYIGMAAMRMPATVTYDPRLFWLSVAIAITASMAALWLAFIFRNDNTVVGLWQKSGAAIVMGFAIAGMHYTGMSAAHFTPTDVHHMALKTASYTIPNGTPLAIIVIVGTVLVLLLAMGGATVDRRVHHAQEERQRERQIHIETERQVVLRTAELRDALAVAQLANKAKSEFLARMSHELRTPLNSIIGFAHILTKNKQGHLQARDLEYVERIGTNGQHLLALINSILDLAKIESGKMEANLTDVAVETLVAGVIKELEGILRDRPITLRTDLPAYVTPLRTDAEKLHQILVNLTDNAVKFTERGSITLRVIVDPATSRPRRIEITDTGVGISPSCVKTIFQPFEQADNSITRRYGGTGLGLAITASLCDLLGIEITVDSTVGQGSTFALRLPDSPSENGS